MAKRGYEFDAQFDAYGASVDPNALFPDLSEGREDFWFDHAIEQYNAGNLSGALISWSHVIAINPRKRRRLVFMSDRKNELHTWKAALRDWDEALRIAPRFMTALVNRGSLKADNGDHQGAISDYDTVIEHASDTDQKAMAHFNRGNSTAAIEQGWLARVKTGRRRAISVLTMRARAFRNIAIEDAYPIGSCCLR